MSAPIWLDAEAIGRLQISATEARHAVEAAFRERAAGDALIPVKVGVSPKGGGLHHAMPAALSDLVAVKWLSVAAAPLVGEPLIQALIVATDPASGVPLAVMDAREITGLRTAAVSAIAAQHLADPATDTLTILGAGFQARLHVPAFRAVFPLRRLRVATRRAASIAALAASSGCEDLIVERIEPARLHDGAELLLTAVSSVPAPSDLLDAGDLPSSAFVAAVDLGISWSWPSLSAFDTITTDDRSHTGGVTEHGLIPGLPRIDADLADLCSGRCALRRGGRTLLLAPGVALADAAMARLVLKRIGAAPRGGWRLL